MTCCAYLVRPGFAAPAVLWLVVVLTAACSKEAPLPQQQALDVTERLAPRPEVPDSR